jgi:hypothetical protein
MRQAPLRIISRTVALGLCALLCGSCSSVVRQGRGSSYLIIDSLSAASGAKPGDIGNLLQSDVITKVKDQAGNLTDTFFEDNGIVTLRLAMKDVTSPLDPTTNNEITITNYHVKYTRADGRNTPGADVPYAFDGAVTGTVKADTALSVNFVLVRGQAKLEAPLAALRGLGGSVMISTIAEVTFYGHDQVGHQVNVTGTITINFADFGDPS